MLLNNTQSALRDKKILSKYITQFSKDFSVRSISDKNKSFKLY